MRAQKAVFRGLEIERIASPTLLDVSSIQTPLSSVLKAKEKKLLTS